MSESKVFMFPETNNSILSMLAPLLQQKGIDPNVLLASRNNSSFGGEGGWFMWVIFLFFLMGWAVVLLYFRLFNYYERGFYNL